MDDFNKEDDIEKDDIKEIEEDSESYPVSVIEKNEVVSSRGDDFSYYGKYIKRSSVCPICSSSSHMQVNLMRAKDHVPIKDISYRIDISVDSLDKHFRNHFIISKSCQKILNLKEESSSEANELVASILEGEVDLYAGAQNVLEAKGQRLNIIRERMKIISDLQENELAEDFNVQELVQLHKVAEDLENSILKTYQIIDKKLFPVSRSDLSNAILQYKLDLLTKLLDSIQVVFIEFEKFPDYKPLIENLRLSLSKKINLLEENILKSGGIITAGGKTVNLDEGEE